MDEPFGVQILHACTVRLLMRLQRLGMSPIEFHQRLWERDRLTINAHLGPAQEPIPEPYRTIQPHQGNTPVWNDWLAETAPEGSA
jgi:hypothetical protein